MHFLYRGLECAVTMSNPSHLYTNLFPYTLSHLILLRSSHCHFPCLLTYSLCRTFASIYLYFSLHQDKLLVAVGLLDCTVKIFFDDTLKFFLSLYGHKLPVMCLDISYDGNILISGSADKTVKIWGLDFGDCHR